MKNLIIPENYSSPLTLRETQSAVKYIKDTFQKKLIAGLNLDRVTAPLIVFSGSGINDDLNGVERKVSFTMKEIDGTAEVVQSLAKWKRMALHRYGYQNGEGIYTDMNALRRDDDVDNTHSIFVDQWDWERVLTREDRNTDFLKRTVETIAHAVVDTFYEVKAKYPKIQGDFKREVFFITSQELEDMYPDMTSKERENAITKEHGTVFISQIGSVLKSGKKHDGRAPDYDDWSLNGDLFFWHNALNAALEISSMGIRVDAQSLMSQLEICNATDRTKFEYHRMILEDKLPLTIGGGIGQSRLCMLMLDKAHIGEVQVSLWPADMVEKCAEGGIILL